MYVKKLHCVIIFSILSILLIGSYAAGEISVVGELYRERSTATGQSYEGTITVSNSSDSKATVKIYQTDYSTSASGKVIYGEPGSDPRSNSDWINIDQNRVQIAGNSRKSFRYEVRVPEKKLAGSYWSTIMIDPLVSSSAKTNNGGSMLTQTIRYCIKIVTNIGTTGKRKLEIADVELYRKEGKIFLKVGAENSGERVLFPQIWADIYSTETGEKINRFEGGRKHIFPGSSVSYNIELSEISKGTYKTMLIFDNGDENVWGAQFKLNL